MAFPKLKALIRMDAARDTQMRESLATHPPQTAAQEWALMEPRIVAAEAGPGGRSRGGRPRTGAAADATVPATRPRALGRDLAIRLLETGLDGAGE